MDPGADITVEVSDRPEAVAVVEARLREAALELPRWVREENRSSSLQVFEKALWVRIALLCRSAVALFLAVRRERLDLNEC
jgi:hypothetical protein